jgi:hypothetical protein
MNWAYRLMDKWGLPTPLTFTPTDEASTWGDCPRCDRGKMRAICRCIGRCQHWGCDGVNLKVMNGKSL